MIIIDNLDKLVKSVDLIRISITKTSEIANKIVLIDLSSKKEIRLLVK